MKNILNLVKYLFINWLNQLSSLRDVRWLIPAHYSAPVSFTPRQIKSLVKRVRQDPWASGKGNWRFLDGFDRSLVKSGVVPSDPLAAFKD